MKIAFDLTLMRPGCVLIQAVMGCDSEMAHHFDTKDWLLAPTPNMKVYPLTKDQIPFLVKKVEQRRLEIESYSEIAEKT